MAQLSPIESEFETTEDAEAYDAWLREKIARVLAKDGDEIPHDEVMAEAREIIERKRRDAAARLEG